MKISVRNLEPTKVKLTVTVEPEELNPYLDAARKEIAKQVNVPGFRKGHVPGKIIDQRIGFAAVAGEAVNDAVPELYSKALDEKKIRPMAQPEFDVQDVPQSANDETKLKFTATVERRPDIELPETDGLEIAISKPEVKDEDVDKRLETLRQRFQQMAFLNKGLKLSLTDLREPDQAGDEVAGESDDNAEPKHQTVTYQYNDGIKDYVDYLVKSRKATPVEPDVIDFEAEDLKIGISAEIAMQWTTAYSEAVHTFANTISTTEGGTHEEGFRAALTSLVNRYAREKNILKDKDENLSGDDVREGLTAVVSVKLTTPQFEGQTKTKLGNSEAKTFVQRVMTDKLGDWFDSHPSEAKNIIQKAIEASRARLAAKKARENTRRKSIFESAGMPDKLKDCQSNNPEECELFIVEGDSAGGSAIQGRNPITQAILPLRGKILNTERASLDRMMKSETIESLITAVGGGYGEDFDLNKVRYHKVIIMADADVDGAHIATLNLTLFFRYMRPMITAGYVYVAMPPLYRLKWTKGAHDFVYTDAERDRVLAEGKANGRQLPKGEGIQRYKGLGEMSYQELWETTMDPEHRILKQVHIEDAAAADETFSMLMGDEVEPRRLFIQRNAKNVRWIDA